MGDVVFPIIVGSYAGKKAFKFRADDVELGVAQSAVHIVLVASIGAGV